MNHPLEEDVTSPQLLSAVYFSILAFIATIVIKGTWHLFDMKQFIPIFQAILIGCIIAAIFGALFGKAIIYAKEPYKTKTFLLGVLMAACAFPLYVGCYTFIIDWYNPSYFTNNDLTSPLMMYGFIFIYSFFTSGWWLMLLCGCAAMFLRSHFVYEILHTDSDSTLP